MTSVAVITIAHGRREHLSGQCRSLARSTRVPDDHVVVAMDDPELLRWQPAGSIIPRVLPVGRSPLGLPLAAARNAGAQAAIRHGADALVFLDVDCLASPGLVADYTEAVAVDPDVLWSGPVTYLPPPPDGGYRFAELDRWDDPHPARPAPPPGTRMRGEDPDLFWSLSFAVSRDAWLRIGGFCEESVGYGAEDTDFAQCAVRAGVRIGWTGGARAHHQYHPTADPPVGHLDDILRNGALFRDRWGRWPMEGWLHDFEQNGLIQRHGAGWERTP